MPELDKDLAATMTPEELAAIAAEESPEERIVMRQAAEAADADDDDEEDSAAATDAKPEAKAEEEPEPAAKLADEKPELADDAAQEFKPRYEAKLPEDFDAQVQAVNDEFKALAQQFKSGDIDFDDYNAKVTDLNARRDELTTLKTQAAVFEQMNSQTAEQEWNWTVGRFIKATAKTEGIDYSKDEEKSSDLDAFVKRLASDPKNADKSMDWFLTEAHRRVKALHGIESAPAKAEDKKDPIADAKKARKADPAAAPKTLAQVPGGEGPGDLADEFADLDKLDGLELETAIAKMTPAQREKFLAAA